MSSLVNVTIHCSQFPDVVHHDLLASLRRRRVNHKFHYDSVKQTQQWLALHQAYAPSRKDKDCWAIYENGFKAAAEKITAKRVHVVGLGCGGGQKDTRLLKLLKTRGQEIFYSPCDVSTAMVLVARQTALSVLPEQNCFPFVCDLNSNAQHCLGGRLSSFRRGDDRGSNPTDDLAALLRSQFTRPVSRITTFFGMIPNFEPQEILPRLAAFIRSEDFLLFSVNLAPGFHYAAAMEKILPQYDNELTRDWLMMFLLDLGVEQRDGGLEFAVEDGGLGLKRVVARFHFRRSREIKVDGGRFDFRAGNSIRLFFSYRYPPELVQTVLADCNLEICERWIAKSKGEGVFLCRKLKTPSSYPARL